uniref:Condensation domain-containing protein n=1 Tax=Candidatus Kentrum sp. TC TaxID=2126339 RepID=A0A450Y8P5_9GAMM|nr:MAG: Condensation domain-containing protein [Candidatus Kentron sp. TC]
METAEQALGSCVLELQRKKTKGGMMEKSSLEYPLSPNQQGLWSLEQRFPNRGLYNLSAVWRLPPDISFPTLRRAVERLCARHPALRTTFSDQGGIPFQVAHGNLPIDFREVRMENGDEANLRKILETQISRPLDLERGPPTRWVLISIPEQAPVLLLIVHHIVADAWTYTEMIV